MSEAGTTIPGLSRQDAGMALALGVAYVVLLVGTSSTLGYARDEGFYFHAAESYAGWLDLLLRTPREALTRRAVDAAWEVNPEHPPLLKALFGVSWLLLQKKLHLFAHEGTSFRFPAMCLSGLGVGIIYAWGREAVSRRAGIFAAVSFAFVPTTFYHAHLACFDAPIAALWTTVAYAYWKSLRHGAPWPVLTGVLFGLAFASKHNSWFLPIAFGLHTVLLRGRRLADDWREDRLAIPSALLWMALLGPVFLVLLWPLLWWDGAARFASYVRFHLQHEYYNMEFLGQTYFRPPMPRAYAWITTAATVPLVTLVAAVAGLLQSVRVWRRAPETERSTVLLWAIGIFVSYAAWLSPGTPIFGGTKHWLTAYPFLCLFGSRAFDAAAAVIEERFPHPRHFAATAALVAALSSSVVQSLRAHPWGLSAYTPLVGGAPGAASLGLGRGFWGYQTGAVVDVLNARVPRNGSVYVHDTTYESFRMLQRDGRLRGDLRPVWSPAGADAAVYHHEQHMAGVEYQIWVALGTTRPWVVRGIDGVPVVMVYGRGVGE